MSKSPLKTNILLRVLHLWLPFLPTVRLFSILPTWCFAPSLLLCSSLLKSAILLFVIFNSRVNISLPIHDLNLHNMIWISTIRYGSLPGMAKVLVHMGTCSCIPIIHKIDYCFEYIVLFFYPFTPFVMLNKTHT